MIFYKSGQESSFFLKRLSSYIPNLTIFFNFFSLAQTKTKAESLNGKQHSEDKITTKSDICMMYIFQNMAFFLDSTFHFSMTGELWMSCFFWHQDTRVTHCQSSVMSFVFMQYSFSPLIRHGLVSKFGIASVKNLIRREIFNAKEHR